MNVLIVSYLPRGDRSHTRSLLEVAETHLDGHQVHTLNLLEDTPDLFDEVRVMAYIERNYLGRELTPEQQDSLSKLDAMADQLVEVDAVILATPMYNFSLPATVKAWFDSVMLKGKTWDANADGYKGLMNGKKALILMSSGGGYEGDMAGWDHAMSLAKQEFTFMGFSDIQSAWIQGVNSSPDNLDERKQAAKDQVTEILGSW